MISTLLMGSFALVVNLAVQVVAVVLVVRHHLHRMNNGRMAIGFLTDTTMMGVVLLVLFRGHEMQFSLWAVLFVWLGEFSTLKLRSTTRWSTSHRLVTVTS